MALVIYAICIVFVGMVVVLFWLTVFGVRAILFLLGGIVALIDEAVDRKRTSSTPPSQARYSSRR